MHAHAYHDDLLNERDARRSRQSSQHTAVAPAEHYSRVPDWFPKAKPLDEAELTGTRVQLKRAEHYMREHPGCEGDEAWDYAKSNIKTPREYKRLVRP